MQQQRRRPRRPEQGAAGGLLWAAGVALALVLVLLGQAPPAEARKQAQPPAPYKAHFSDFYQASVYAHASD